LQNKKKKKVLELTYFETKIVLKNLKKNKNKNKNKRFLLIIPKGYILYEEINIGNSEL